MPAGRRGILWALVTLGLTAMETGAQALPPNPAAPPEPLIATVDWADPDRTWDGYTLLKQSASPLAHWIAMDGSVARTVDFRRTGGHVQQLPSGNLLGLFLNTLIEHDSRGRVLWEYAAKRGSIHHDFLATPEGTFFAIVHVADRETDLLLDSVIEVSREKRVVWCWDAKDHIDIAEQPPYVDTKKKMGAREWLHANSIDRFPDGDILLSLRNLNRLVRIDYPSGDVVWSWGDGILGRQHSAKILPNGNITLFDNGIFRRGKVRCDPGGCMSRALEVDPEKDEIVWKFEQKGLFSIGYGDVDRLPNGNTLITYGQQIPEAVILEVTQEGDVVWSLKHHERTAPVIFGGVPRSLLYRSQRVAALPRLTDSH